MIRSGHFRHELFWSLVTWRDGFLWSILRVFVLAVDGILRVGTSFLEKSFGGENGTMLFLFYLGCGPCVLWPISGFQSFRSIFRFLFIFFSQKKKNPIYLFIIYKFYCYKLNHNFCQLFTKITGPCKSDNQS